MLKVVYIYAAVLAAVSFAAFFAYGSDKKKAKQHRWRTRESVLLGLGFFGGGAGALLGMHYFRHKTRHWYFHVINWLGMLWQLGLLFWLFARSGGQT